jgi:cell division transport system ATP-binding protein
LLKLLYLAQRPSRGAVRLFGEDAGSLPRARLPGFRRRIGVVFQDFRLVPHLSAYDNIALPLRVAGVPESDIEAPVREMLAWVGLTDRGRAKPPTLSGGEQQRIAIARAVIARPELLVADEPTGNVDPDMAERLLHLFESLNRLGTTVVVATHDFHLLNRIPNAQMMRIEKGRLNDPTGALRNPPGAGMKLSLNPNAPDRRLLDEGRRTRAMTWIMAIMLFLTVLAGALGLGMFAATAQLDRQLAGRLTVQIVEPNASCGTQAARSANCGQVPGVVARRKSIAPAG